MAYTLHEKSVTTYTLTISREQIKAINFALRKYDQKTLTISGSVNGVNIVYDPDTDSSNIVKIVDPGACGYAPDLAKDSKYEWYILFRKCTFKREEIRTNSTNMGMDKMEDEEKKVAFKAIEWHLTYMKNSYETYLRDTLITDTTENFMEKISVKVTKDDVYSVFYIRVAVPYSYESVFKNMKIFLRSVIINFSDTVRENDSTIFIGSCKSTIDMSEELTAGVLNDLHNTSKKHWTNIFDMMPVKITDKLSVEKS